MAEHRKASHLSITGLYTLPNFLSILRCFLGPVLTIVLTGSLEWKLHIALGLLVFAELTDYLDGALARRFNQESKIGQFIDPICDSIYHLCVFMAFLSNGWMPAWMMIIIYARDLAVPYIRTLAKQHGKELSINNVGKIKTATHGLSQIGVVAVFAASNMTDSHNHSVAQALLLCATIASVYSLYNYSSEAIRKIKGE